MMGISMPNDDSPILKNTNAILAFNKKDSKTPETTECINCGRCVAHCPMKLMPAQLSIAYENRNAERLQELKVNICMECGCCSYVCPAGKPLVQTNKLAKAFLKTQQGAVKK
jgi:electron transport complex protein RnfC